jgi:hypothetical protein
MQSQNKKDVFLIFKIQKRREEVVPLKNIPSNFNPKQDNK